jgi:hypothetical protein
MSSTQEVGEIFGAGSGPAHAMLRSPTVLIASVGLWGMNVFFFRVFGIDFVKVMKYDLLQLEMVSEKDRFLKLSKSNKDSPAPSKSPPSSEELDYGSDDDDDYSTYDDENSSEGGPLGDPNAVTWERLVGLSMMLLFILHSAYYWWIDIMGGGSVGAIFAFYGAVTVAIIFPFPSTRWLRKSAVLVLQRVFELINPRCSCVQPDPAGPRPIPFVDVFFADAMCSLSKVFFDWGMLFHMATHYPDPVPASAYNILIPSACAAVPYLVRARQCLVMYSHSRIKNDPSKYDHLWNAGKYSTSIFPLCLSAFQKTVSPKQAAGLEGYLILLLIINTLYALYWDIVMDWGMMKNLNAASAMCIGGGVHGHPIDQPRPSSCGHACLRPRLRFGLSMSAVIVLTDAVLRFSWVLRFYHSMFPSADSFTLCTQFLEIFRRSLWNLLRMEWEQLKQLKINKPATVAMAPLNKIKTTIGGSSLQMQKAPLNKNKMLALSRNGSDEEQTAFLTHRGDTVASTNGKVATL